MCPCFPKPTDSSEKKLLAACLASAMEMLMTNGLLLRPNYEQRIEIKALESGSVEIRRVP